MYILKTFIESRGGGGGGAVTPLDAVPDDPDKTEIKGMQIRGGRGTRGMRKGCQICKHWGNGYPYCYDQSSSHVIKPGKGR